MSDQYNQSLNFLKAADGHRVAAMIIEPHVTLNGSDFETTNSVFCAYYNVLGFAFELYLKAYLCTKGYDQKQLSRRPFGHDLKHLRDVARAHDLVVQEGALKVIIEILSTNHGEYTYRYLKDGANIKYILKGEPTALMFQTLVEMHAFIEASVNRIKP